MRLLLLPECEQTYDIKRIGVRVSVGRKEGNDITLQDIVVSGLHCYVTVTSTSSAVIEDQSTNGTYVNGVKVGKSMQLTVKDGDVLTLGKPNATGAQSGSISFKIAFDGKESDTANAGVGSIYFKNEIEDLKVAVSTAQHRNEVAERRVSELSTKLNSTEFDLKKSREENVELNVRNDVMRAEIDQLRGRLAAAERSAADADRRTETLQNKVDMMEREFAEINALKASMNLKHSSLGEEIARLRQENAELNSRMTISGDVRARLMANLGSIQQLTMGTMALVDERINNETIRMMDHQPTVVGVVTSPQLVQMTKRSKDVAHRAYPTMDHPVMQPREDDERED